MVKSAKRILILQPEKPDTDSLGSALALEQILGDLGKEPIMYCHDPIADYLRQFDGWDRVTDDFPKQFDLTIVVDFGSPQQLERTLIKQSGALSSRPFVVLDHHKNRTPMDFAATYVVDIESAATGELIAIVCHELGWNINLTAAKAIVPSIMSDTLGLSTPTTTARTIETLAEMVRLGVDMSELRRRREEVDALDSELVHLKGALLTRAEFYVEGQLALVVVTPEELSRFASIHDPADLVNQELRTAKGVLLAAVLRNYNSELYGRKIKISLRANLPIAAKVAEHFDGGGHDQAASCTITGRPIDEVKAEFIKVASEELKAHAAL